MPLVTAERWQNRRWSTDLGPRGSRITAWGVPLALRLHDEHPIQAEGDLDGDDKALVGPGRVGRHYDLPGGHRLIWREVKPGDVPHPLRPFEETPGELDHLAEHGVRLSVLRLARVPEAPVWRHILSYPPGTRFVHQPPLTQVEIDEGGVRPKAVVGSYAVLDAEGCKIGHILRPCAISADRTKRAWGAIRIEGGISEVAFRPDDLKALGRGALLFGLDTFGFDSVGGSLEYGYAFKIGAGGKHSPAQDGNADSISFYYSYHSPRFTLGLYEDASDYPGALVADSDGDGQLASADWLTLDLDQPCSVSASTSYWIAAHPDDTAGDFKWHYDGASGYSVRGFYLFDSSISYTAGQLPDPFPSGRHLFSNRLLSIYVTYTPSGGPTGVAPQFMHLARIRRA